MSTVGEPADDETRQMVEDLDDEMLCDMIKFMLRLTARGEPIRHGSVNWLTDEVLRRVAERTTGR